MSYKVAPLTVNPRQKSNLVSRVFVSQPSAEEELLAGRLFILLELETERPEDARVGDFIIADAYRQYYENEIFMIRERFGTIKPELVFESAIAKLNRNVTEFIEQEKIRLSISTMQAVIGIVHGNKLFFSQVGSSKAILLYRPKNKSGEMLAEYNLVDITEKTNDPTQEIAQANKFFTNVVAGAIPAHGYFFFANESLFEYLTKKQVCDIITTLPPSGAAEQMKLLLDQTNAFVPFFGLILKNTTGEHDAFAAPAASIAVPGNTPAGAGRSSVHQLNQTQEKTEQLLSPSGIVNLKKWLTKLRPASNGIKSFAKDKARRLTIAGERLGLAERAAEIGRRFVSFIAALGILVWKGAMHAARFAHDPRARREIISSTRRSSKSMLQYMLSSISRFNSLDRKRKTLLIIITVCVLGLLINVVYSGIINRRKEASAHIAQLTEQFTQKENQLEAALLYNNREAAKQIIDDMSVIVAGFPNKTEKEKEQQAAIKTRYEQRLDGIYSIVRLHESKPLLELVDETDSLISDNGSIFAVSSQAKSIRKIASNGGISEPATHDNFPAALLGSSFDAPSQFYIGSSSVLSYQSETNTFTNISIDNPTTATEAAVVYNNRLYSAGNGGINRFNFDQKSKIFTSRMDWHKDSTLGKIKSMAIDGRVYLIENNSITKLSGGKRELLSLDEVSPKLEEPSRVSVSPDLDFLYILEPKNKRLLVYSKNGVYKAQYTGDQLTNLKDAVVDQRNRIVYLLNGKSIYSVEAKHLQ